MIKLSSKLKNYTYFSISDNEKFTKPNIANKIQITTMFLFVFFVPVFVGTRLPGAFRVGSDNKGNRSMTILYKHIQHAQSNTKELIVKSLIQIVLLTFLIEF